MGSGAAKPVQVGRTSNKTAPVDVTPWAPPLCDRCVGQEFLARGWCPACRLFLCERCVSKHTRSHKLAMGRNLPAIRPEPGAKDEDSRTVIPISTLLDRDIPQTDDSPGDRGILGCVCVEQHVVTIGNRVLTVYNEDFTCIGEIQYPLYSPLSICARELLICVSFERIRDINFNDPSVSKLKKKMAEYKDIQIYQLQYPTCTSNAKVVCQRGFNTAGECFAMSVCPTYRDQLILAVGLELSSHPERDDIQFILHIIQSNGNVLRELELNPIAEPCFTSDFYLTATWTPDEIIVSEPLYRRVRGVNMRTGKTMYQYDGGSPQGVVCSGDNDVYVYNDGQLLWMPEDRGKLVLMQQDKKKKTPRKDKDKTRLVSLTIDPATGYLYQTSAETPVIHTYKVS